MYDYAEALLERRPAAPSGDLISSLLAAEAQGDRLSHVEYVNLVVNVLAGGIDTTQSQLAHALRPAARTATTRRLTWSASTSPSAAKTGCSPSVPDRTTALAPT